MAESQETTSKKILYMAHILIKIANHIDKIFVK